MSLTKFQKQLCNVLQKGLPVCPKPFARIAESLDSDEKTVLQEIEQLKKSGIIRRVRAMLNYRALGRMSTLVAAHVPEENLQEVTEAVNSLANVSHNYLREHYFNMWFTLQADSDGELRSVLAKLSGRFGIDFHSLPVVRVFKLDVRFDAGKGEQLLSDVVEPPKNETVEINESEKLILSELQNDIELISEPFAYLYRENLEEEKVLRIIQGLIDKGVIRRMAGVVDQRRIGFDANVLFAGRVGQDKILEAGSRLARLGIVSHCYERKTFEGWPYNLFAMMHAWTISEIEHEVDRFVEAEKIASYQLLPTAAELKKQPVKHRFD
jgi:DNA-binding Lrp family transcriptional regulator